MEYIKTKHYPVKGFNAITHYPFVFYKKDSETMRRHEAIHGEQQKELFFVSFIVLLSLSYLFEFELIFACSLVIYSISILLTSFNKVFSTIFIILSVILNPCFYIIYLIEWAFKGYRGVSFEKEAYQNGKYLLYKRKIFQQWRK